MRQWPHFGPRMRGTRCGMLGGRPAAELKSATCKTVRASTPYPPVLEPGIEEIGWLFGALKVQGLTAD